MKKLSKIKMLVASAFVFAVFTGCPSPNGADNGASSGVEANWEADTILANKSMVIQTEGNGKWTYTFEADGKHLTMNHTKTDHDFYGGPETYTFVYRITSEDTGYIKGNGKEYTFTYKLMGDAGYLISGISIFENNRQNGYFAK